MAEWNRKENGEIDREKVIDELERDLVREPDEQTHIIGVFDQEAVECALELLKAQEALKPVQNEEKYGDALPHCPLCEKPLPNKAIYGKSNFCYHCGQAVKWE